MDGFATSQELTEEFDRIGLESADMSQDGWKLLGYGLLTALLMGLVLVPILTHNIHFPKPAAEAILAVIAGAVFLLYKYIERRKKSG